MDIVEIMKYKCGVCNGTGHLEFRFSYKNENDIVRILVLKCQCDDGWVDWRSNIVNESRKELEDYCIERHNLLRTKLTPITKEEYISNYDIAIENQINSNHSGLVPMECIKIPIEFLKDEDFEI